MNGMPVEKSTYAKSRGKRNRELQWDILNSLWEEVRKRPQECDKKYIDRRWFMGAVSVVGLIGLGTLFKLYGWF